MAIQLSNKPVTLENGVTLDTLYVRTSTNLSLEGDSVQTYPSFWVSKEAFDLKKRPVNIDLSAGFYYSYDRVVDGSDLLSFSNQKVKETFESLGFSASIIDL